MTSRLNPSRLITSASSMATSRSLRRPATMLVLATSAAALALGGIVPASAAPVDAPASAGTDLRAVPAVPAVPSDVVPLRTNVSLLAEHHWYQQVLDGFPVVGGLYAQHVGTQEDSRVAGSANAAGTVTVWDGRVETGPLAATSATVSADAATDAAVAHTGGTALTFVAPSLWVLPGAESALVWKITTQTSGDVAQSHVTYVDAVTGTVRSSAVESRSDDHDHGEQRFPHADTRDSAAEAGKWVTGKARTFDPNPVAKLQDQDLTDDDDADSAVPKSGYSVRKLRNLDKSHTLVGRWARVINSDLASEPDDKYMYWRSNDDFEQVMSYYGLDTQQMYYRSLGFTDVNAEAQKIQANGTAADNSYYSPAQDLIVMGSGGVDDAEDPEVTWHEAGHATQDAQVPGFGGSGEAGAIGEAYGDYIAVTLSSKFADDTDEVPEWCVMDWDAVSYSEGPIHCLRTTVEDKHYPEDLVGQVHADGEIWSQALYEMNLALGWDKAARAIIEAQFSFTPSIGMKAAAKTTIDTTRDLYGKKAAKQATKVFAARGLA